MNRKHMHALAGANPLCRYPGGVQELKKVFPTVLAVPFDAQQPEFQSSAEVPWQGVLAYKRYEIAIYSLPLPMAIVCRSARRSGAVYAAYRVSPLPLYPHPQLMLGRV